MYAKGAERQDGGGEYQPASEYIDLDSVSVLPTSSRSDLPRQFGPLLAINISRIAHHVLHIVTASNKVHCICTSPSCNIYRCIAASPVAANAGCRFSL